MKLQNNKFFNLYDTNGRRNDIINAYCIYTDILEQLKISPSNKWGRWPNSIVQFQFYEHAIARSPEIFKKHDKYDAIIQQLENDPELKTRFFNLDSTLKNEKKYTEFLKIVDKDIEARARHYTSNLVKIGFANKNRELTEAGKLLLHPENLIRDPLEQILPIKNTNIILLRQLSRLLIFNQDGNHYYWPFGLALYLMITNNGEFEANQLENLLQVLSPNTINTSLTASELVHKFNTVGITYFLSRKEIDKDLENNLSMNDKIDKDIFYRFFKNNKSQNAIDNYFEFYNLLFDYVHELNNQTLLDSLLSFLSNEKIKSSINKAFGNNSNIFKLKHSKSINCSEFLDLNKDHILLNSQNFNINFYNSFKLSKELDNLKENKHNIGKLLTSTGLISQKNGLYRMSIWKIFHNTSILNLIENNIFGHENIENYEELQSATFFKSIPLTKTFNISNDVLNNIIFDLKESYNIQDITELAKIFEEESNNEFVNFIEKEFPKEKTFNILSMFQDRSNDSEIQNLVTKEADIPTIFEYIIGIAWYYLSDNKNYDVLNSFNLTMNGNYLPISHAGGGYGDIEIDYEDKKILIEVTLMNAQAQKRGEWEPVLRHSVNLATTEKKETLTLFVANVLDLNTINIWRAVASVPLQSTINKTLTNRTIAIMPLQINELIEFSKNNQFSSEKLFANIKQSFDSISKDFDNDWRTKILNN